jgi:hypothetical protein
MVLEKYFLVCYVKKANKWKKQSYEKTNEMKENDLMHELRGHDTEMV